MLIANESFVVCVKGVLYLVGMVVYGGREGLWKGSWGVQHNLVVTVGVE